MLLNASLVNDIVQLQWKLTDAAGIVSFTVQRISAKHQRHLLHSPKERIRNFRETFDKGIKMNLASLGNMQHNWL